MTNTSKYFDEEGGLLPEVQWNNVQRDLQEILECIAYVLEMFDNDTYAITNKSKLNRATKLLKSFVPDEKN